MPGIDRIQAQMSLGAVQSRQGRREAGERDLKDTKNDRKALRTELQEQQRVMRELSLESARVSSEGFFKKIGRAVFGRRKAGHVQRDHQRAQADVQKAEQKIQLIRAETQEVLSALENSDKNLRRTQRSVDEILGAYEKLRTVES